MPSPVDLASRLLGLPLHPAVIHFPIVATALAAVSFLACLVKPPSQRKEWLDRATLLLFVAVLTTPAAILSGLGWSRSMGLWNGTSWLPPGDVEDGLLRRHVLGAVISMGLASVALLLALVSRRRGVPLWPVIFVVAASAIAAGLTAHIGGAMVFGAHS